MADIYFSTFYGLSPVSCTIDSTPPTFGGITSVTPQSDGTFTVTWSAATSTKTPVRYEIYVSLGVVASAALFVTANRVAFAPGLLTSWRVGWLRDQITYFINGQIYTFGVRAVDSQNYSSSNVQLITSTAIASGNIGGVFQTVATNLQNTETAFSADVDRFEDDLDRFEDDLDTLENIETDLAATAVSLDASADSLEDSAISIAASAISIEASAKGLGGGLFMVVTDDEILDMRTTTPILSMEILIEEVIP